MWGDGAIEPHVRELVHDRHTVYGEYDKAVCATGARKFPRRFTKGGEHESRERILAAVLFNPFDQHIVYAPAKGRSTKLFNAMPQRRSSWYTANPKFPLSGCKESKCRHIK